jgi:acyl-CoA reductase-like NAD-dependent aldehyde dehydrogenase
MMMAVWKIAPAIAAGNTVVLKPSDTTPVTALRLAELAADVLPPGVLNVVCGDRDTGRALVDHRTPQMVAITGSVRAGAEVAGAAARDVKRVHLELGGKAPVIVFDDADLEAAAEAIAMAGYFNAGQDCTAASRVLAAPGIYDDLVAALTEHARSTATTYEHGAQDEDALVPPVNNANQLAQVIGFLYRAPDHAQVTTGGNRQGDRGFFVEPTVVAGLRQDDEMVQREIFGPVITVQRFRDEEEAVRWAGSSTASPPVFGPRTSAGPCERAGDLTSGASGSTPTSHWSLRCRMAGSNIPATARTCRSTGWRTTRASSTLWPTSTPDFPGAGGGPEPIGPSPPPPRVGQDTRAPLDASSPSG